MEKVYLKYDNVKPYVECDYGFAAPFLYLGFMYPYKKKDYYYFSITLLLQMSICTLILILVPVAVMFRLLLCLIMIAVINFLFASNYNMMIIEKLLKEGYYPMDYKSSDKLIKKGIYFKLQ